MTSKIVHFLLTNLEEDSNYKYSRHLWSAYYVLSSVLGSFICSISLSPQNFPFIIFILYTRKHKCQERSINYQPSKVSQLGSVRTSIWNQLGNPIVYVLNHHIINSFHAPMTLKISVGQGWIVKEGDYIECLTSISSGLIPVPASKHCFKN